jgi:ketosteroid isomerase-like protein
VQLPYRQTRLFSLALLWALALANISWAGQAEEQLLKIDREAAALAKAKGAGVAVDKVYAPNIKFMMQGVGEAISGKVNVLGAMKKMLSDGTTLNWTPEEAVILSEGQSGYTIGRWVMVEPYRPKTKAKKGAAASKAVATGAIKHRKRHGHYATVWTKQPDGQWRIVLDVVYRGRKPAGR